MKITEIKTVIATLAFLVVVPIYMSAQESFKPSNILTPEQKVYGLSKFWQEANYNFVFMEKVDRQVWDSTYTALLKEAIESKNDWEYYKQLQKLSAILNDGHTEIYKPRVNLAKNQGKEDGKVFLPEANSLFEEGRLNFMEIEGDIVVSSVSNNLAVQLPLGSVLKEVNGLPVEQYLKEYVYPYISQSAAHIKRLYAIRNITQGRLYGDKLSLKAVTPQGKEVDLVLTFGSTTFYSQKEMQNLYLTSSKDWKLIELEWLADGIAHLSLNSFEDDSLPEKFKELLPELRKAKGLIIDLRKNGGGNTYNGTAILEYLSTGDKLVGSKSRTRQNISAYKAWGVFQTEKDTIANEFSKKNLSCR